MTDEVTILELRSKLEDARELAASAAYDIAQISQEIISHPKMRKHVPDSGSKSFKKYGLKTVTGYTGKWDQAKLATLYQMFVDSGTKNMFPFEVVSSFKVNQEALEKFIKEYPDWGPAFSDTLTTKPKNPGVYVVAFEEGKK